jgi:hypothetical protein
MERKDKKSERPATHPAKHANLDKTEAGASRLYAPGKPREVEAGPSRVQPMPPQRQQFTAPPHSLSYSGPQVGTSVDTTEAGPARIVRYRK